MQLWSHYHISDKMPLCVCMYVGHANEKVAGEGGGGYSGPSIPKNMFSPKVKSSTHHRPRRLCQ